MSIFSIDGVLIGEFNYTNKLNLSFLQKGSYILKVKTQQGQFNKKFVKL